MAIDQTQLDNQAKDSKEFIVAEIRKREIQQNQKANTNSKNTISKFLKGLLFWNKESYLLFDNNKHITISHANDTSKMTYIDGDINEESQSSITEKTPKHYINSGDCKVGTDASHPDTRCDELMILLEHFAKAIDSKYGPPAIPLCSIKVAQMKSQICSDIVKIA